MKIGLVTPAGPGSRQHGNRATAVRWARFLRQLGHEVLLQESWEGEGCGMLIALHARRSHPSIERYAAAYPDRPLVVALTGTDLYRDIRSDTLARQSLEVATFLIVLQELGMKELEPRHRSKTRVIYQSAESIRPQPPAKRHFDVCVIGNLRAEKDPFRCALATQLLPLPRAPASPTSEDLTTSSSPKRREPTWLRAPATAGSARCPDGRRGVFSPGRASWRRPPLWKAGPTSSPRPWPRAFR